MSATMTTTNAIQMIKADHTKVKDLMKQFEESEDRREKKKLVAEVLKELKVHAAVEEDIFYPAVRQEIKDKDDIMEEADEEHHVAKVLIAELEMMRGNEENFDAKFIVLCENIRHHIKEEESEMLPKARKTNIDFDVLGEQMTQRKEQLLSEGVPPGPEADMIHKCGLRGDSPSKKAAEGFDVPYKYKIT